MADLRKHSSTSNVVRFALKHSTTGVGLTGLTSASSGLIVSTIADNEATATLYTVAASNVETISTLGTFATPTASKCRFKEIDATNHKGLYEFHFADARFAMASSKRLVISVTGAANLLDTDYEIQLVQVDHYDAARFGMTALPNAIPGAAGGVFIAGSNAATTANVTGNLTGNVTGSVGSVTGAVGSVTAAVTAGTVTDKTGYGLSGAAIQAIWDALTSALTAVGSVGKKLADWSIGTAQTGDSFARLGAPAGASISADIAGVQADTDNIQTRIPTALLSGRIDASVGAMAADTLTASALASDAVAEVQSGLSTLSASGVRSAVGLASANLDTQIGTLATTSALSTVAGYIDTEIAAIKAKTDTIPVSPAAAGDAMALTSGERNSMADALLARALTAESYAADGAVPTLSQALYMLLSELGEFSISGTTITCKKLDGSTTAMTFTLDSSTAPTSRTRAT